MEVAVVKVEVQEKVVTVDAVVAVVAVVDTVVGVVATLVLVVLVGSDELALVELMTEVEKAVVELDT